MNIFHLNNRNSRKPKIFNATTSYSINLPFSSRSNSSSRLKSLPAHSPFSLSRSNSSPAHSNLTNFDHVVIRNSFSSRSGWHLMRSQCDPSWPWRWSYHRKLGCSRRIIVGTFLQRLNFWTLAGTPFALDMDGICNVIDFVTTRIEFVQIQHKLEKNKNFYSTFKKPIFRAVENKFKIFFDAH